MPPEIVLVAAAIGALVLVGAGIAIIVAKFYRQVDQGRALIVNTMKSEPVVTFTGRVVYPIIHRAEEMDISVKTIDIDRRGKEGLICRDNIRADIKVAFFVRVNKTAEDVLKVAQSIGCKRASDPETLNELFNAKFSEALKTAGKQLDFADLYTKRSAFKDQIVDAIAKDLNGFVLDDAAIDFLEQTPIESLDKDNIMDSEGIEKITRLTVIQNVKTNELRQKEKMEVGSQNLAAAEALFEFERREAEALAKKEKEVAIAKTREQNEAARIANEEQKRTQLLHQKNEEEVKIAEQAKLRGVAVAEKNREREIAVEVERVEKAKQVEATAREREVELQRIAKEKDLEEKRKEIAEVIRGRVAVDKTVAEEEERIKDLRALAEANRQKDVVRITAEAQAQEHLVKEIKAAEASEEVAKFRSREKLVVAEADLEASDKSARAKIRMAEGVQAEQAASGLAEVKVKEADALAFEKRGMIEARVELEKMQAKASGEEKQGLAKVKVREAEAAAIEKQGMAEALVAKERALALAAGEEQKGLAEVRVKEAAAVAIERQGGAEAVAIKAKLVAEAAGLAEKAAAMKALDGVGRDHEEFRLRLEKDKAVELETIHAKRDMAEAQAKILSQAFQNAKINIVGGDGAFFDRFVKAVSVGQSIDGVVDQSETVRTVLSEYLTGSGSLPADLKDILSRPALSPGEVQNLTISALLGRLMMGADPTIQKKLGSLAARAKELGVDDLGAR